MKPPKASHLILEIHYASFWVDKLNAMVRNTSLLSKHCFISDFSFSSCPYRSLDHQVGKYKPMDSGVNLQTLLNVRIESMNTSNDILELLKATTQN